jgi:hypothetical protein
MEKLRSKDLTAPKDESDAGSTARKSALLMLRKEKEVEKDSASTTVTGGVIAGVLGTAGLLTMAYGALEGSGGLAEIAVGGTAVLFSLVVAVIPHHN